MDLPYREYGDETAPLIIFLHGGGVSGWMWDEQIQYFSSYHCIVPDLPEHGLHKSDLLFSIEGSAEAVAKLIEMKAVGRQVMVVGFSLGAQVLVQLLSIKPHLIDVAVINSALVRPMSFMKTWISPTLKLAFPLIKYRWFAKLQAQTLYINDDRFENYYEESSQMKLETLIRVMEENMTFSIPSGFRKAKAKILVTVGKKEKLIMKKSAKALVEANSYCKGIILARIGHGVPMAEPQFFNQLMEAWLLDKELPKERVKEL